MIPVQRLAYFIGLPVLLIVLWWALSVNSMNFYVPKPLQLVQTLWTTWIGERFIDDVLPSLSRLAVGLISAIALGMFFGLLIGSFRWLRNLLEPLLEFFRAIPPPVLVPLLMLLIGVNDAMKVAVIISGALWPVLLNTVEGVRAVDSVLSESCRSYGITGFARIRYLILPAATPQIMAGVRQSLSIGLILMVISEMFASSSGLGFTIVQFQRNFAIPEMWSGIVVLGLLGLALSLIFQYIERRVLHWYHGLKEITHDS